MTTPVLVPWRSDHGPRERLWTFVENRLWGDPAKYAVFEGDGEGDFSRAKGINAAAEAAGDWDVAIIADADTIVPDERLDRAVEWVRRTGRVMLPFDRLRMLNVGQSETLMRTGQIPAETLPTRERPMDLAVSSLIVTPREVWDAVGGFDEAFVGYGWEDRAFMYAVNLHRPFKRMSGSAWHLWHPPSQDPESAEMSDRFNRIYTTAASLDELKKRI